MITIKFRYLRTGLHVVARITTTYTENDISVQEACGSFVMMHDVFAALQKLIAAGVAVQDQTDPSHASDDYTQVEFIYTQ